MTRVLTIERAEELIAEGFSAHWLTGHGLNVWAEDQDEKDGTLVARGDGSFVIATVLTCTGKCGCTLPVEVHEGAPGWAYAYATGPDTNGDHFAGCCDLRNQEYVCVLDKHGCSERARRMSEKIHKDAQASMAATRAKWAEEDARKAAAAAAEIARPKPHCGGCGVILEDGAACRFCEYSGPVQVR